MAQIDNNDYILQPHIMRPIISSLCTLYKSHSNNPIESLGYILLGLSKKPAVIDEVKASVRKVNEKNKPN